jgi:hypothetical protein
MPVRRRDQHLTGGERVAVLGQPASSAVARCRIAGSAPTGHQAPVPGRRLALQAAAAQVQLRRALTRPQRQGPGLPAAHLGLVAGAADVRHELAQRGLVDPRPSEHPGELERVGSCGRAARGLRVRRHCRPSQHQPTYDTLEEALAAGGINPTPRLGLA